MSEAPDAMQTFLKDLKKLEGLDLKKIFEEHHPPPVTEKHIQELSPEKLMAHLRRDCHWQSWSHMPNLASMEFQGLMGQYYLIVGNLGDRGGTSPIYPYLHDLGTHMDSLGSNLHEEKVKESKEAMQKTKQSYTKLHAVLEAHDIKPDNQKDPMIVSLRKMMTPLLLLGSIPLFAALGTSGEEIPKLSKEFISESQKFREILDARLADFDKNKMVPESSVYKSKLDALDALKDSPPKKVQEMQDKVAEHVNGIKESTEIVNKSKSEQDFLPGSEGHDALQNMHQHLEGLDKAMPPEALDPSAKPIGDIGETIAALDKDPEAASKLLTQSTALHESLAKGFTGPNIFKQPLLGGAVAMVAPFYFLQGKIPSRVQELRKHAAVADDFAHNSETKAAGDAAEEGK